MTWHTTMGKTRHPCDGIEEGEATMTGNPLDYASDVSWWDVVIAILPGSESSNFSTTLHTADGDALITVSPSVNFSTRVVGVNDCIV